MKTPLEIIKWCDMMIGRHPNVEDLNYFNSIKVITESKIKMDDIATENIKRYKEKEKKGLGDL